MRYLTSALWEGKRLLLDDPADWAAPIETRHEIPAEIEGGLDSKERRAERSPGRCRISQGWSITVRGDAVAETRRVLQTYQNETLLIPIWPFVMTPVQAVAVGSVRASLWLFQLADGTTGIVSDPTEQPAAVVFIPVVAGRWREDPRPALLSAVATQYSLDAEDNQEGLWFNGATSPEIGPADGFGNPRPILPGWPNFAETQAAGAAALPVTWRQHNASLTRQSAFYAQPPARQYRFGFTLSSQDAAVDWLAFWSALPGPVATLWLPSFTAESAGLLADAPAGATSVQIDLVGVDMLANQALALFGAPTLEVVRVTSVVGTTANLAAPLAHSWGRQDTLTAIASLARFASAELRLSWSNLRSASCQAIFVEVPWEYATPAGETVSTMGTLGSLVHLYTFQRWTSAGNVETRRYTDSANGDFIAGNLYSAAAFSHPDITQSLNLEDNQITIQVRSFSGDPLTELMSGTAPSDSIWTVEIAESINSGTPRVLFYGELVDVSGDGPWLEASCVRLGGLPERKFPSALVQTTCNYAVFSRACGLVAASWTFGGLIDAVAGVTVTVSLGTLPPGVTGTAFAGFFTGGLFQANQQTSRIVADALSGGQRILTLERSLALTAGPAAGCFLLPGCDGAHTTCRAYHATTNPTGKFNNFTNYGGFPWFPLANPTFASVRNPAPAAGKK
jgi:hypothetical protein